MVDVIVSSATRYICAEQPAARPIITARTMGWVYLFHFSKRIGNTKNSRAQAQHYIGFAADEDGTGIGLEQRIAEHLAGQGACITRAALAQGSELIIVATWRAPLSFEKELKRRKDAPNLCPICCEKRGRRPIHPIPTMQLELQLDEAPDPMIEFPDPPRLQADWFEINHYRRQRELRPIHIPTEGWDDGLL